MTTPTYSDHPARTPADEEDDPRLSTGSDADAPAEVGLAPDLDELDFAAFGIVVPDDASSLTGPLGPLGAASWRNCRASGVLLAEVNARWPRRDKKSDGSVGDTSHRARKSDHNPVPRPPAVVRARDFDVDGILAAAFAEHIRSLGKAGHPALRGGYVIYNRRIAGTHTGWAWKAYTGANPHTSHIHVSFGDAASAYDSTAPWNIKAIGAAPPAPSSGVRHTHATPTLRRGMKGQAVRDLQADLRRRGSAVSIDGDFGPATANAVTSFQRRARIGVDGVCGPGTWRALHAA